MLSRIFGAGLVNQKRLGRSTHRLVTGLALSFALFGTSACSGVRPVELGQIPTVTKPSPSDVAVTKAALYQKQAQKGRDIHQGCKFYTRSKGILDRLTAAIGAPAGIWPLYMVDAGSEANAMAVNQNTIVVYEALLARLQRDDEVATILAHEIGHILAAHGNDPSRDTKVTLTKIGSFALGAAVAIGAGASGMDSNSAGRLGRTTLETSTAVGAGLMLQYDRDQEYQADQIGLMIMAKAGYDPRTAIDLWNRAPEIFGASSGNSFLSTHPAPDDRADELQEALPIAMKYYDTARTSSRMVSLFPAEMKAASSKKKKAKK